MPKQRPIRVLVVDDSAFVRRALKQMLEAEGDIEVVGTAKNGREALAQVSQLNPDVVTTDLIMPEWDGLAFIRAQMRRRPVPIVVVSVVSEGGEKALKALEAGAVDFVQKPTRLLIDKLFTMGAELRARVRAAAQVSPHTLQRLANGAQGIQHVFPQTLTPRLGTGPLRRLGSGQADVVVIASSTGGPQALRFLLSHLPRELPVPVLVAQHMPEGYTRPFAERLDAISPLEVVEAENGLVLKPGRVVIGRAGWHLKLIATSQEVLCRLSRTPQDKLHFPSADVLFRSAAEVYGNRVLAVVLTGMGNDGQEGAAWVKAQGGHVVAEAEATAVVYGMPRAVIEAGLADTIVPLDKIPQAIVEYLYVT